MEMAMVRIAVAKDFNKFPGGRYPKDGTGNGQDFRKKFLLPHLLKGKKVEVVLDVAAGFSASFLEEAFGGLIREGLTLQVIEELLTIIPENTDSEIYKDAAWQIINEAAGNARVDLVNHSFC